LSKFTILFTIILAFLLGVPSAIFGQEMTKKEENKVEGFRTVHLVNLKSVENEAEFIAISNNFNEVVAELGYQNIRYNIWKESGYHEGQYKYIFESTWPDQETFDKVHKNEKFQAVWKTNKAVWDELIKEDTYNRYILLN
jgi:quinol monooxygenase YgiN